MTSLKSIYKIPFLGVYLKYLNAFAYKGNAKYLSQIAPLELWRKRVFPPLRNSLVISFFISIYICFYDIDNYDPGEYILGAVPDLLGFAIGVFALIFAIPNKFLDFIRNRKGNFKPKEIPANVSYPLVALSYTLLASFFLQLFPNENPVVVFLETFIFIYAFEMIMELIRFISLLSRVSINFTRPSDKKLSKFRINKSALATRKRERIGNNRRR